MVSVNSNQTLKKKTTHQPPPKPKSPNSADLQETPHILCKILLYMEQIALDQNAKYMLIIAILVSWFWLG